MKLIPNYRTITEVVDAGAAPAAFSSVAVVHAKEVYHYMADAQAAIIRVMTTLDASHISLRPSRKHQGFLVSYQYTEATAKGVENY